MKRLAGNWCRYIIRSWRQCSSKSTNAVPQPEAPIGGMCCGNGCANCVWIEYGNALIDFYKDQARQQVLNEIEQKVQDPNVKAFVLAELKMKWKNR